MAQLKDLSVTGNSAFGGNVVLDHDPTSAMQAATKQYVDNASGSVTVFTTHDYQPTISGSPVSGYDISGLLPQGLYQAMVDAASSGFPVFIDNEGDFDVGDATLRTYYYNGFWTAPNPAYVELVGLPECDSNPQELWVLHIFNGDTFGIIKLQYGNVAYGNITTSGTISNGDVSVATNDSLLIRDNSDSGKIVSSSLKFNTSASGEERFLSEKGRWGVPTGWVSSWSSDELALQIDGTPSTGTIMSGSVYQGCYDDITGAQLDWYVSVITDADGLFTTVPYHTYYYVGSDVGAYADFIRYISYDAANSRFISLSIDSGDYFKITAIATGGGGSSVWVESGNTAYYPDTTSPTMSIDSTNDITTINGDLVLNSTDNTFASPQSLKFNLAGNKQFKFSSSGSGQNMDVGWDWSTGAGSGIGFRSKDHSNAGQFFIYARNTTSGYKALQGTPAGVLTWDGRTVVTGYNIGDANTPVYINGSGYPVAITGLDTKKLTTSTLHVSSELGDPTMLNRFDATRANRLMFLPANQIIVEKTTDGGTTWVDAGISDANKVALFSEKRPNIALPLLNGEKSALCGLRVTFTAMKYNVPSGTAETLKYNYWNSNYISATERYVSMRGMYFWLNQAGGNVGIGCKIERAKGNDSTNWGVLYDSDTVPQALSGYSGADYVNFGSNTFGGSTAQTGNFWNYRITFFTRDSSGGTDVPTGQTSAQSIYEIRGYGENYWTASNSFMARDHLYDWDYNKNATFPAKITVGSAPTANMDVATKQYVDNAVSGGGGGGSNEYILEAPGALVAGGSVVTGSYDDFQAAVTAMQAGKKVYVKIGAEQIEGTIGGGTDNYLYELLSGYHSNNILTFCWKDYISGSWQDILVQAAVLSNTAYWSIRVDSLTAASGVSF